MHCYGSIFRNINLLSNREIKRLHVKCWGGEWVGTVSMIEGHVATCGFILVPCPNLRKDNDN